MSSGPIRARDVQARRVEWLWRGRIPRGMITIVAGKPDQGKGLFTALVTADVTNRGGRVLYAAIEDSPEVMTRPRLEAAGANLNNTFLWDFELPRQLRELAAFIIDEQIDLVVMDPIAGVLGRGVSRFSDKIRTVSTPLKLIAEGTGVGMIIVEHQLKSLAKDSPPLNAIPGIASGLPAASRMAYLLGKDPQDPERRILACVKANVRNFPLAATFEVDTVEDETVGEVPLLLYTGEEEFEAEKLIRKPKDEDAVQIGRPPDRRAAAAEWLANYLFAAGGPVQASQVLEDAKHYGMASKTLRRAADDMEIVKDPEGGGRNCTWDLPKGVKDLMGGGNGQS